jgi:hypothetical protein
MTFSPYRDSNAHLRDELRRVWLCVEYHIRSRWEAGILPQVRPDNVAGLFHNARAQLAGDESDPAREPEGGPAFPDEGDADAALFAFQRHSEQVEGRIRQSLLAGVPLPLIHMVRCFELTPFQRATLTMALMQEVDPDLLLAYRYLSHDPACRGLDARLLAMLVYETPEQRLHLSHDLSPLSPLIRYRLLEQEGLHEPTMYRRIQPSPRLVQIMTGGGAAVDPQLREAASVMGPPAPALFPADLLKRAGEALKNPGTLILLQGQRGAGKRLLLQTAAQAMQQRVLLLNGRYLAGLSAEAARTVLAGLLREARLLSAVPTVADLDDVIAVASAGDRRDELPAFLRALCTDHPGPIAITISGDNVPRIVERPVVHLQLGVPPVSERGALWRQYVPGLGETEAMALAERFVIPGGVISQAARSVAMPLVEATQTATVDALDQAVRGQLHDRLSRLGRRLDTPYSFDDLVVDDNVWDTLWEIVSCVRERRQVRERWGFRGAQGVSVLFSGDPGVGKTMSATVLSRELGLLVYEIDLSRVVSKWIGETEKNLSEVFDAAEPGHVILLFKESDSLFGKRTTEVKSANDRNANLETNYLLQRLERFGGLAILTTNLGKSIDVAFRRRFAYDVQFSFPTVEMREELWRRAIPPQAEVGDLDPGHLARQFELSGGFIKVAVERAAFVAAGARQPIDTEVIGVTVQRMYQERGKLAPIGRLD